MTGRDAFRGAERPARVSASIGARQALRLAATGWVQVAAAALTALAMLTTVLGIRSMSVRTGRYEQLLQQAVVSATSSRNPISADRIDPRLRVARAPAPMSALVRGLEYLMPTYWDFSPSGAVPSNDANGEDVDTDIGPALDLEFLIRALMGLFALAVAFGTIRDVETTYAGLRGFPVSALALWAGLMLGDAIVLLAMWLVVVAAVSAAAAAAGADALPFAIAAGALTVPAIGYLGAMAGLGSLLALIRRGAVWRSALVLAVWLVSAVLEPAVVGAVVKLLRPTTPASAMVTDRAAGFADAVLAREEQMGALELALSQADHMPSGQARDDAHRAALEREYQRHTHLARTAALQVQNDWNLARTRQRRLRAALDWLNPASLFWTAASDVSHTGAADRNAWDDAIERHARMLEDWLYDDHPNPVMRVPEPEGGKSLHPFPRHDGLKSSDLPAFNLSLPPALRMTGRWFAPTLGLFAYALIFGAVSAVLFCRRL